MTPEGHGQIGELFHAALELEPGQRAAFLDQACAGDETIRRQVESLLVAHDQAEHFLSQPAGEAARLLATTRVESPASTAMLSDSATRAAALPAQFIGHYKLIRELGHGGMGAVYLAERADEQYSKQVAIKLLRRGPYDDSILRRFRTERQILASLDHLHIARFLDGGVTEAGDPYFVMEYIEGAPLDEYCDARRLSIAERLKLFRDVCSAAQYAHQNLIIHRDLKPSNILVNRDGVVKLLDFGIAKLLEPESFAQTVEETVTGVWVMTPQYASPEQVRGEALTTASDVYSLGVILYELLSGHRPYHFYSGVPDEIARVICESAPLKPSAAITRVEEITTDGGAKRITPESVSAARGEQPAKLRRRLADELDNIVLMALRKEPQRRYASVEQFLEDVRRFLEGLPVSARPDTLGYRSRKFVKRHRRGVMAAGLVVLTLLAGIVGTSWQAMVARRERARAEQRFNDVRKLARSFMFEFHDGIERLPGSTPMRELLVKRALEYLDSLSREAASDPALQRELATAYEKVGDIQGDPYSASLGDTASAVVSHRKSMAIREALVAAKAAGVEVQRELASSYLKIGDILWVSGDWNGALEVYRKARAINGELAAADPANSEIRYDLSLNYMTLGDTLAELGKLDEALASHRQALRLSQELAAGSDNVKLRRRLGGSHVKVADVLARIGDLAGALDHYRRAVAILESLAESDPGSLQLQQNLAGLYQRMGEALLKDNEPTRALDAFRRCLAITAKLAAADPSNVVEQRGLAAAYNSLGRALAAQKNLPAALAYQRKMIEIASSLSSADPSNAQLRQDLIDAHYEVGRMLKDSGNAGEAEKHYRRALELAEALAKLDAASIRSRQNLADISNGLGQVKAKTGDVNSALELLGKALAVYEALSAETPASAELRMSVAEVCFNIAGVYKAAASNARLRASERTAHWQEARSLYRRSLEILIKMRDEGVLPKEQFAKVDEITSAIARCEAALAELHAG